MSDRATALADQLAAANDEAIAVIGRIPDGAWTAKTPNEEWPLNVTAHHIAASHLSLSGLVRTLAAGTVLPVLDMNALHGINAKHAADFAGVTKDQVLADLRANVVTATAIVRGLSDQQLDITSETFGGHTMTVQAIIENVLIRHVTSHLESIRQAAGR